MFLHVQDHGGWRFGHNQHKTDTSPRSHRPCATEGKRFTPVPCAPAGSPARRSAPAPCLLDFALLHPDPDDTNWLRPVPPSVAARPAPAPPGTGDPGPQAALRVELTDSFEPFLAISAQNPPNIHAITVLEGFDRINAALDLATAECRTEVLTIQPGGAAAVDRPHPRRWSGRPSRDRPRGQHPHAVPAHRRHSQGTLAYVDESPATGSRSAPWRSSSSGSSSSTGPWPSSPPATTGSRPGTAPPRTRQVPRQGLRAALEPGDPADRRGPLRPTARRHHRRPALHRRNSSSRDTWTRPSPAAWA